MPVKICKILPFGFPFVAYLHFVFNTNFFESEYNEVYSSMLYR